MGACQSSSSTKTSNHIPTNRQHSTGIDIVVMATKRGSALGSRKQGPVAVGNASSDAARLADKYESRIQSLKEGAARSKGALSGFRRFGFGRSTAPPSFLRKPAAVAAATQGGDKNANTEKMADSNGKIAHQERAPPATANGSLPPRAPRSEAQKPAKVDAVKPAPAPNRPISDGPRYDQPPAALPGGKSEVDSNVRVEAEASRRRQQRIPGTSLLRPYRPIEVSVSRDRGSTLAATRSYVAKERAATAAAAAATTTTKMEGEEGSREKATMADRARETKPAAREVKKTNTNLQIKQRTSRSASNSPRGSSADVAAGNRKTQHPVAAAARPLTKSRSGSRSASKESLSMSRESLTSNRSRSRDPTATSATKATKNDRNVDKLDKPKPIRGRRVPRTPDDVMTTSVDSAMMSSVDSAMFDSFVADPAAVAPPVVAPGNADAVAATTTTTTTARGEEKNAEEEAAYRRQVSATSDMGSSIDSRVYVSDSCAEAGDGDPEVVATTTRATRGCAASGIPLPRTHIAIKPNENVDSASPPATEEEDEEDGSIVAATAVAGGKQTKKSFVLSHIMKARRGECSYIEAVKRLTKIPERRTPDAAAAAASRCHDDEMQMSTDSIDGGQPPFPTNRWSCGTMDASGESLAGDERSRREQRPLVDSMETSMESLADGGGSESAVTLASSGTVSPDPPGGAAAAAELGMIAESPPATPDSLSEQRRHLPETCDFTDAAGDPTREFKASPDADFLFLEGAAAAEAVAAATDFVFMAADGRLVRSQIDDEDALPGGAGAAFADDVESVAEVVELFKVVQTASLRPAGGAEHVVTNEDDIAHIMRESDIEVGSSSLTSSSTVDEISDRILDQGPPPSPPQERGLPLEASPRKQARRLTERRDSVDSVATYGSSLASDDLMMDQDLSDVEHEAPSDGRTNKLFSSKTQECDVRELEGATDADMLQELSTMIHGDAD
ncbi:PREDICTED: uncharacterized protein LOC106816992, partial [Priapulus caudatus]|uniref:Uncharacterized protein LOC106816992 n=1 Tax=Priapulus caudatus TaxID=37621 RepID=A0ABM1EY52_PRICU